MILQRERGTCRVLLALTAVVLGLSGGATAQQGDQPGEEQPPLPADLVVPPAPVLSPADALASLQLNDDGLVVELVASEPLVVDPVAITFGADGRMWVVEMRSYMPNIDGTGEDAPIGRIAVLSDTDGDGRMDHRVDFMDDLVLPRSVAPTQDGALVIVPPDLLYCRDTDGDGRADERTVLYSGFGGLDNPEHAGNGLLRGIDNWLQCSQQPVQFRFDGVTARTLRTHGHGQWGITMDDVGRLYYSPNSDPLRVDVFPPHYAARNPHHSSTVGMYARAAHDHRVWPVRVTPGVNRGYRQGLLEKGRLTRFTAACGPLIYRDVALGAAFAGNAFVCEPSGNLVKRFLLEDGSATVTATPAYEQAEFLASTDERFRPVNLALGPDGAIYVVDFYRGIIQHRIFMTTFLRRQLLERGLDAPAGLGRIYRVRATDADNGPPVDLARRTNADLVELLESPNGWRRDTSQRLLVERRARDVTGELRRLAVDDPVPALHALWTLEGTGGLTVDDVVSACRHRDPHVRAAGIRLCEPWLDRGRVLDALGRLVDDSDVGVRAQLAFTLGEDTGPAATHLLIRLITRDADLKVIRSAVCSSLRDREVDFLRRLLARWTRPGSGRRDTVAAIADCALRDDRPEVVTELVELTGTPGDDAPWFAPIVFDRMAAALRVHATKPRRLALGWEPTNWSAWLAAPPAEGAPPIHALDECLTWPGRRAGVPLAGAMNAEQRARFKRGRGLFALHCASCHQPSGRGQLDLAPSLVGTSGPLGSDRRLARIVTGGLTGRLTSEDMTFDLVMPKLELHDDESVAAVLTYVRRAWGNDADPVEPATVAAARAESDARGTPWTVEELRGLE